MTGFANILRRLWTGIFLLSLLLAPLAGRTMEGGDQDKTLSINGRSEAVAFVVGSPSLFAKPISAPEPAIAPFAASPFLLFLTALAAILVLAVVGGSALGRPESTVPVPWLRARVRVVELRV